MAVIYAADVFCDDCGEEIRDMICSDLWANREYSVCPDGTDVAEFSDRADLYDHLIFMDERHYDSDAFPKHCSDDEEADCPQHCGGHDGCENAYVCADGTKIGYFFGNELTTDGADYVREAVIDDIESGCTDSVALEVWYPYYSWIDWSGIGGCDECGAVAVLIGRGYSEVCQGCVDKYGGNPCWRCPNNGDSIACSQCESGWNSSGDYYPLGCTD
ncbi:MAG: hypothetical protein ACYTFQ_28375 [Planctomycetota bacterium]|jgi:hypothetical protein